ncbi:MAG: SRPBCC family protein [Sphingomonadaceae bacterium]
MTDYPTLDAYGALTEPATLTIERLLSGPVERVWDYLTKSELRRQWLAAGDMEMRVGTPFTFTWRNDELSGGAEGRPEGHDAEHSMDSRITEIDPPRKIAFEWGRSDGVTITLEPRGEDVLLTLVHRRLPEDVLLSVAAGWHAHLGVMAALVRGQAPAPFWAEWARLRADYAERLGK